MYLRIYTLDNKPVTEQVFYDFDMAHQYLRDNDVDINTVRIINEE